MFLKIIQDTIKIINKINNLNNCLGHKLVVFYY